MLELRPNCELCDKDLLPDTAEARICTYECTFCSECVEQKLKNVCPNCGGGFVPRPIRPKQEHRPSVSLKHDPASKKRVHLSYTMEEVQLFSDAIKDIDPADR